MKINQRHQYRRWGWSAVLLSSLFGVTGCSQHESTEELQVNLGSTDSADRLWATRVLQTRPDDAEKLVPVLIKSLGDTQAQVRRSAAISLGYCGAEAQAAIPALEERQQDPDPRVREAARTALERIQG
ncbi:MAG: HEAT repeat domain-containing protein [Planctomycetes bacterium]|nr:HEAT repeat domain-containing protein [Planctomycetota bacterium]